MDTHELQKTIKELAKKYGWTQKQLAKELYVELYEDDDEEASEKFEETLRKQLNRETTNPATLQAYLDIMIQDSKFKSLHMTIPKPLVTSILDKDIIDGLAHISKKITQKLEADI